MARSGEATVCMQTFYRLFGRDTSSPSVSLNSQQNMVRIGKVGRGSGYVTQGNSTSLAHIKFGFNLQHCKIKKLVLISKIQIYLLCIYTYFSLFFFLVCVQCRCVCVCTCTKSCKGWEVLSDIFLYCFISYFWGQDIPLGLKVTNWLNSLYRDL